TVAVHGGPKPALRAPRQPFERHLLGRPVDAAAQLVHRLEARLLGGDQPQHDLAIRRHYAQRLEVARALVVVLEQEPLETALLEHTLDRLVPTARAEPRLVVAAADMQAEDHARMAAAHRVVPLDARVHEPIAVAA